MAFEERVAYHMAKGLSLGMARLAAYFEGYRATQKEEN
jgi:hypothetical protein